MVFRKLDELGRVVLPKEMRRVLRLECGDLMTINNEGNRIIIEKYVSTTSFNSEATRYLLLLASLVQHDLAIVTEGKIQNVYSEDGTFHQLQDCTISDELTRIIVNSAPVIREASEDDLMYPAKANRLFTSSVVFPVTDINGKSSMAIIDLDTSGAGTAPVKPQYLTMLQLAASYLSELNHIED